MHDLQINRRRLFERLFLSQSQHWPIIGLKPLKRGQYFPSWGLYIFVLEYIEYSSCLSSFIPKTDVSDSYIGSLMSQGNPVSVRMQMFRETPLFLHTLGFPHIGLLPLVAFPDNPARLDGD